MAFFYVVLVVVFIQKSPLSIIKLAKQKNPLLGNILGLVLVVFFFTLAYIYLYDFQSFMSIHLPRTPPVLVGLILVLLCSYVVKLGLEVMAGLAAILIPFALFLVAAGIILNFFTIDIAFIPPVLPLENWGGIIKGTMLQMANYGELLVLTMLLPEAKRPGSSLKPVLIPVAVIGLLIVLLTFSLYGTFGSYANNIVFKLFGLYRKTGPFESVFIFLWVSTFLIKISLFYYAVVRGLSEVLELEGYKLLVMPVAVLISFTTLISFDGYIDYNNFLVSSFMLFELFIVLVAPLLLVLALLLGSRKGERGLIKP
ncbi:MAG: spore germination protein [Firmicutes bacterium]|nr:spore germination protein [Bacillota bacterium]